MCGRYVTVKKTDYLEKTFQLKADFDFRPNYNVSAGNLVPVITSAEPKKVNMYCFGFSPSWGSKRLYVINARAEGDRNQENDPKYKGPLEIVRKPMWMKPVRSQRCLVFADAFIEGTTKEKLKKPFLVYPRNRKTFAMAGIYDKWTDRSTGEIIGTFAIITTFGNKLMQEIGHHRCPVILSEADYQTWLDETSSLQHLLPLLHPFESEEYNAYPISPAISNPRNNGKEFLKPFGQRILREFDEIHSEYTRVDGFKDSNSKYDREYQDEREEEKKRHDEVWGIRDAQRDEKFPFDL